MGLDRKPKKSGKREKKRGISNLKIAVVAAQGRNGQVIAQKAGTGRVRAEEIDAVIESYIDPSSLFCYAQTQQRTTRNLALKH